MTFDDILKDSFAELMPNTISPLTLLLAMGVSLLVGMGIFFIYRKYFVGVVYDHAYNMSLVVMTVLTSLIIVTISANVALSLGMVLSLIHIFSNQRKNYLRLLYPYPGF